MAKHVTRATHRMAWKNKAGKIIAAEEAPYVHKRLANGKRAWVAVDLDRKTWVTTPLDIVHVERS